MKGCYSFKSVLLGVLLVLPSIESHAQSVSDIQTKWATITFQTEPRAREEAYATLSKMVADEIDAHPKDARLLTWEGIVLASEAKAKGGLGALSLAKRAKKNFEDALAIEPTVLNGSAYTSLGSLYYKVPPWPIGFGDKDKARELLQKGVEIDPTGMDSNYFYGDFLLSEHDYAGAVAAFEKGLAAPSRPGREVIEAGRRKELQSALARAKNERN
jgi:tetratricopeptide (TPR) repeat protein